MLKMCQVCQNFIKAQNVIYVLIGLWGWISILRITGCCFVSDRFFAWRDAHNFRCLSNLVIWHSTRTDCSYYGCLLYTVVYFSSVIILLHWSVFNCLICSNRIFCLLHFTVWTLFPKDKDSLNLQWFYYSRIFICKIQILDCDIIVMIKSIFDISIGKLLNWLLFIRMYCSLSYIVHTSRSERTWYHPDFLLRKDKFYLNFRVFYHIENHRVWGIFLWNISFFTLFSTQEDEWKENRYLPLRSPPFSTRKSRE